MEALHAPEKISLKMLAEKCGVSSATASRALAGRSNVSDSTRENVLRTAEKYGYSRNQLVSKLMSHVRAERARNFVGNLGIVHIPSFEHPGILPMQQSIIDGAAERAGELGFHMDLFSLGENGPNPDSLGRMLRARGILGVIFMQPRTNQATNGFQWDDFASLHIDFNSAKMIHHTVCLDHHLTLTTALDRLRSMGYQRLGMFIAQYKDERLVHKWSAAFRSFQENQGGIGTVPVLMREAITAPEVQAWYQTHRPDLIIGHVDQAISWLNDLGISVPADLGFFNLNWNERQRPCAGLDLQAELHGRVAVETLAAQIQRNERGLPDDPRTVMISGRWVDGPTLRETRSADSAKE